MKKKINTTILKTSMFAAISSVLIAVTSCNNRTETNDSKEVAEEHNEAKFTNAKEDDAQFLVDAAEINLEEIQLGQLAQNSSVMPDVKELGVMMVKDHTKALNDLQALAAKKQITLPTSITKDGENSYKKLSEKTGSDFDKEYCDLMVKGHKDAIHKFEKASTDSTDADIQSWAATMLVVLRTHLDHSLVCQNKCSKM